MSDTNALPLLLAITQPLDDIGAPGDTEPALRSRVLAAAVSGWMEGHLASPGHRLDTGNLGDMPHPPFPSENDPELNRIVDDACLRFGEGEEPAAVSYAAALSWQAGRRAGGHCVGCAPYGYDNPITVAVRTGCAEIELKVPVSR